ncbi:MAG TPA: hypothetical protein VIM55_18230 [Mucilaginibacter sp.]
MNTENEKRLDDLFKKKLEDPVDEIRYEEGDWDALEQMLDKPKRKGIAYLWPILSGVAAMLLLFLGWWMFAPKSGSQTGNGQQMVKTQAKKDTIIDHQAAVTLKRADTIIDGANTIAKQNPKDTIIDKAQTIARQQRKDTSMDRNKAIARKQNAIIKKGIQPQLNAPVPAVNKPLFAIVPVKKDTIIDKAKQPNKVAADAFAVNQIPVQTPANNVHHPVTTAQPPVAQPTPADVQGQAIAAVPAKTIKPKTRLAYRPQFTLGFVAAPDINGVGSFAQSKVGTNVGMTFAVGVSRKLSFNTGVIYSVKPYFTNFSNYNTGSSYKFPTNPQQVTADCRMLDIPLNVNYQVFRQRQNRISIGTGLSSYIMMHESYKFTYANDAAAGPYGNTTSAGPASYTVPNHGKYFFGVMNLNATYERQLNSKVGISVQPYLKVPLTNIGYSQVKLQTTGVAVGLNWNLNSLTKP